MRNAEGTVVAIDVGAQSEGVPRLASAMRSTAAQMIFLELSIIAGVLAVMETIGDQWPWLRIGIHLVVPAALAFFAIAGLAESIAAWRPVVAPPLPPGVKRPPVTAIVAAYLPNEYPIIMETVRHHLATSPEDLQLIVAYNTPEPMAVEAELLQLASEDPRFVALCVEGSKSKAENVNAAVDVATGDLIAIFDADHHPAADAYDRAWRSIAAGADVVQGRCVVRKDMDNTSPVAWLVAAEMEQMYTVGHPGRSRMYGFGLFCGSNGYWRAEMLRKIRLDETALTEDIDASVRLLKAGATVAVDREIISTELAPPSVKALCHQRMRWGQGWFQVRLKHLRSLMQEPNLSPRQRFGAFWMLGVGSVSIWASGLVMPLWFDLWLRPDPGLTRVVSLLATFGTIAFGSQLLLAYRKAVKGSKKPHYFIVFLMANGFFYAFVRIALVRLSHLHEAFGSKVWRVTPRTKS